MGMPTSTLLPNDVVLSADDPEQFPELLPDHFEIIDGRIVETPYMSNYAVVVANRLNRAVDRYLEKLDLGETGVELLYHIPQPEDEGRNRRPDWSFVSFGRWPKDRPFSYRGRARDVVPDIVAEVVSPTDFADELLAKVREYLRGGVRLVWVVYPLAQEVHAYWPGTNQIRAYTVADELDAGEILPGFQATVANLFPPVEPGSTTTPQQFPS